MKIGILTFHFACNYGAVLQCYALQKFLSDSGHEVEIIDYRPASVAGGYRWFDPRRFWGITPAKFWRKTSSEIKVIGDRKRRYEAFDAFVRTRLNLSQPVKDRDGMLSAASNYDILIAGSDQIWNRKLTDGTDPLYWGDFFRNGDTAMISYAASMEDGFDKATEEEARKFLPRFNALSVREPSLAQRLMALLPLTEVAVTADPTLLLSPEQWDDVSAPTMTDEPYLLFYQVRKSSKAYEIAKAVAESKGLKLVCLSAKVELENSKEVAAASPEEFLSLFRHASYVVTTSFHGTVFSVVFHKDFLCPAVDDGKNSRQDSLLAALGLGNRVVNDLTNANLPAIAWEEVETAKAGMLEASYGFLKSCGL